MDNEDLNVWLPPENKSPDKLSDSDSYLQWALANVATFSRDNVNTIVNNLIQIGFVYHAARCLEISAQHNIGVFFTGNELISYRYPNFGNFHRDIQTLLEAGCLYIRSNREKTASIAFNRALSFVEEALRQIESYEKDSTKDVLCLGLAFELAGHCCFPVGNQDGIEYYKAAVNYWDKSYEIDPYEVEQWKLHPVTKTVMNCLKEVAKVKVSEETTLIPLLSMDYQVRINKAKELVNHPYLNS